MAGLIAIVAIVIGTVVLVSRPGAPSATKMPARDASGLVLSVASVERPGTVATYGGTSPAVIADTDVDPAIAATSNGSKLFVLSGLDAGSTLKVIGTTSGETLIEVPVPGRWRSTLPAYFDVMTVSSDDRWLFVLGFASTGAERDGYFLHVFDIAKGTLLAEPIPLPGCAGALVLPGPSDIEVMCPHSGTLLSMTLGADGSPGIIASVDVSRAGLVGAARLTGDRGTIALTREGNVVRIGRNGVERLFPIADGIDPTFDGLVLTPAGDRVFIARGVTSGTGNISLVEAYGLDGRLVSSERLEEPAWSMTIDVGGSRLLLPAMDAGEIVVLDTRDLSVEGLIPVPGSPVWVIDR